MSGGFEGWKAYLYDPSMAAAAIFIVLYGIVTGMHSYYLFRTRTRFFIPMVLGGYFEFIGYIGRAISSSQTPDWTLGPYIMQSVLLLVAPALFAASIYMYLGRIIALVRGEKFSFIRVSWMTKIFVAGDILSFLMQSSGISINPHCLYGLMVVGAGILVTNSQQMGENIIVGGLFVQIIFFGFFVICSFIFQRRINSNAAALGNASTTPWLKHLYALYGSSILILIRSIFRVIEYLQGWDGFLLRNEAFIYVFDALLMWLVLVIFVIIHPSEVNCLLGRGRVMITKGGLSISEVAV
ncbi:hypothetical protein BDW72DRAFT_201547 [Aspergillus terricola var. indicus]